MGWTSYHATNYKNGKVDRKAEMDKLFTWSNDHIEMKVLKSTMVSTVYYAAIEEIRDGKRTVFAAVCITAGADRRDPFFNIAYKDMDETMGPCYYDCPKAILDLLTETDSETAKQWRRKCEERREAKKRPSALKALPEGGKIEYTDYRGEKKILIKHPAAYQFKTWFWYDPEAHKYISKKLITENNAVVVY